jgi:hypothetical protein
VQDPETYIANWITTDTNSFTIPSEGSQNVNFTINIPANATPGGHYGAVLFNYEVV